MQHQHAALFVIQQAKQTLSMLKNPSMLY